jgi:hypothetical protein
MTPMTTMNATSYAAEKAQGAPVIYLDMDGVCADFLSSAARLHGHDPREFVQRWPKGKFFPAKEELPVSRHADPRDRDPLMGPINRLGGERFWTEMEPTPWFKELYRGLNRIGRVEILTAPSEDPFSRTGKIIWIQHHATPAPHKVHFSSD